jgi:hypothetical protein
VRAPHRRICSGQSSGRTQDLQLPFNLCTVSVCIHGQRVGSNDGCLFSQHCILLNINLRIHRATPTSDSLNRPSGRPLSRRVTRIEDDLRLFNRLLDFEYLCNARKALGRSEVFSLLVRLRLILMAHERRTRGGWSGGAVSKKHCSVRLRAKADAARAERLTDTASF